MELDNKLIEPVLMISIALGVLWIIFWWAFLFSKLL